METYFICCLILLTSFVEVHSVFTETKEVSRGQTVILFANVTADSPNNEVHLYINGVKDNTLIAIWKFKKAGFTTVFKPYHNIVMGVDRNIRIYSVDETNSGTYSLFNSSRPAIKLIILGNSQIKSENPSQIFVLWIVIVVLAIAVSAFILYVACKKYRKYRKMKRASEKDKHEEPPSKDGVPLVVALHNDEKDDQRHREMIEKLDALQRELQEVNLRYTMRELPFETKEIKKYKTEEENDRKLENNKRTLLAEPSNAKVLCTQQTTVDWTTGCHDIDSLNMGKMTNNIVTNNLDKPFVCFIQDLNSRYEQFTTSLEISELDNYPTATGLYEKRNDLSSAITSAIIDKGLAEQFQITSTDSSSLRASMKCPERSSRFCKPVNYLTATSLYEQRSDPSSGLFSATIDKGSTKVEPITSIVHSIAPASMVWPTSSPDKIYQNRLDSNSESDSDLEEGDKMDV